MALLLSAVAPAAGQAPSSGRSSWVALAKGGFVVKQLPVLRSGTEPGRDQAAVLAGYRTFIRGLLDLTDTRVDGRVVPPAGVVRHDGDDPYLVVAADKGTSSFSDVANELAAEYAREGRGFQLARVAGGYRFQTHPDAHPYVERFVLEGQTARLSGPALETLAIIAYRQPVSRPEVDAARGVHSEGVLGNLLEDAGASVAGDVVVALHGGDRP